MPDPTQPRGPGLPAEVERLIGGFCATWTVSAELQADLRSLAWELREQLDKEIAAQTPGLPAEVALQKLWTPCAHRSKAEAETACADCSMDVLRSLVRDVREARAIEELREVMREMCECCADAEEIRAAT